MSARPAYITTPIYYVNDRPHIGHLYTTTICDVWARFMRFLGRDVFFLTGTDEHGIKVEKSAQERGISPQELADENAAVFQSVLGKFHLTNDDFIRTTQADHERQVQHFVKRLLDSDAVYLGEFEGWYDEGQEEYYTETQARKLEYKSPVSGRPLVRATEQNYYFRLSAFQDRMERLLTEQPDFVRPEARRNEVLGRLREGIQDVPITRTNFTWGVPMPGDPEHVIYVWIDALLNYITALGLGEPESDRHRERSGYWPATVHVIGKEILWFHAVIWPSVLMALEMPLPDCVYAHSFWISEGQKMSKSLGNFIDLEAIDRYVDTYGLDMWRYYLATQGPLGATDADFAANHFHEVFNTDLVNTVGNCASRVTAMINKYCDGTVPTESPDGERIVLGEMDWPTQAAEAVAASIAAMTRFDLAGSIGAALGLVRQVDGFINRTEPFKLAKDPEKSRELGAILYQCAEAVRIASLLLWPVMPGRIEQLWEALGLAIDPQAGGLEELAVWGGLEAGTSVEKVALFPRVDAPVVAKA
ncbi:MAG: methionine--tRNA ligase [Planctomycetes bacterium]|nr:methionine--tRNA ligase [Planctomycetota bacterium]